jgi:branched-chain amino acid transport system ATP-binding protein
MLLELKSLDFAYGDVQVLWDINVAIEAGEIVALVGSNGAGKSTLLKNIAGLYRPIRGEIAFNGENITKLAADARVHSGIALVPEGRQLFFGMTVRENLMIGAYARRDGRKVVLDDLARIYELFPELSEREGQLAGTLSGGEQQMCAVGRGLMSAPRLLLIDELSLGLAPVIVDRLMATVKAIHQRGVTIFLVEQDIQAAFEMAGRGYVMETGHIVQQGTGQELLADEKIKEAYLGI